MDQLKLAQKAVAEQQAKLQQPVKKPKQIISSLFTFNPSTKVETSNFVKNDYTASNGVNDGSFGLLDNRLVQHLAHKMDITKPTAIQSQAFEVMLEPSVVDYIIHSQTGSGKSLAYLLPVLHELLCKTDSSGALDRTKVGTYALILCPTRELVTQVAGVLNKLLSLNYQGRWIVGGSLTGGENRKSEKARLKKGVTILVSTPGRLTDHLQTTNAFFIGQLRWLVVDEADRFLELGFENSVKAILRLLEEKRTGMKEPTVVLCSATVSQKVKELGGLKLNDPQYITARTQVASEQFEIPNQLKQQFMVVPAKLRLVALCSVLMQIHSTNKEFKYTKDAPKRTVVFFSNCESVSLFYKLFTETSVADDEEDETCCLTTLLGTYADKVQVFKLHGNIAHKDRQQTFKDFGSQTLTHGIMLATDVAARGLDLKVTNVIQYEPPSEIKDYIHRLGRTARIGESGESMLMIMPSEIEYLQLLETIGSKAVEVDINTSLEHLLPGKPGMKKSRSQWELQATELQLAFEKYVQSNLEVKQLARKAYLSSVRAYATHPASERHIFHVKRLHLGHLMKSFCLRDKPSNMKDDDCDDEERNRKRAKKSQNVKSYTLLQNKHDEFNDDTIGLLKRKTY